MVSKVLITDIYDRETNGEQAALLVNDLKRAVNELADPKSNASYVEIWSGSAVASLDLTSIPGGYPGDGIYILTLSSVTGMLHFLDGEICFSTVKGVTGSIEVYKDQNNILRVTGSSLTKIRKFKP